VLESQPEDRRFEAKTGRTNIFHSAGVRVAARRGDDHQFSPAGASTLIALVAALVGLDEQRRLYQIAIDERYRFFSYGDAMFIE